MGTIQFGLELRSAESLELKIFLKAVRYLSRLPDKMNLVSTGFVVATGGPRLDNTIGVSKFFFSSDKHGFSHTIFY